MARKREYITAHVLADALNLSVETIWRYTREKKIPFVELGGKQYRYSLADVIGALERPAARENTVEYERVPGPKLTYQDYLKLPEEPGCRYEILEGVLVKDPSPAVIHQRVLFRLARILEGYFRVHHPEGELFIAPVDVTLTETTVIQPDLFFVSGNQKEMVKDTHIDGPPAMVIEIISPSTGSRDRVQKMSVYKKAGVQHYWLVNPEEKTMECFALRGGDYYLAAAGLDQELIKHPDYPDLAIDLAALWPGCRDVFDGETLKKSTAP